MVIIGIGIIIAVIVFPLVALNKDLMEQLRDFWNTDEE